MKNKFFLAIVALVFSSGFAFGQTGHYKFNSPDFDTRSMVTVSSINTYNSYVLGANDDNELFIGQLDNSFPQQLVDPTVKLFQLPTGYGKIFLTGGFFDEDDDIVVYGYEETGLRGIIVKVEMDADTATSIRYSMSSHNNTPVNDGCYSRAGIYKTYDLIVSDSIFMRVPATLTGSNPMNIVKRFPNARMMSVSWDDTNSKHVVSGCKAATESSPFKNFIGAIVGTIPIPNTNYIYTFSPSGYISSEYTNKHILSGNGYYSDGIAYLIQDLRDTSDALWVMKVNYLNGNVYGSNGYLFDSEKVLITDASHNFGSLFVLGHHNGFNPGDSTNFECRYISQINLYDSTDYITKHMMDANLRNLPWVSTKYITRQVYLNNIIYNHYTSYVQAAGAINPDGMLVETFDMTYGSCDSTINNYLINVDYADTTYNNFYFTLVFGNIWADDVSYISSTPVASYSTEDMSVYDNCISYTKSASYFEKYEQIQQLIKENQELYNKENSALKQSKITMGQIDIPDNQHFVCREFGGTCHYEIFDLYGRLLFEGSTVNGEYNILGINASGMYLIKVTDEKNNVKTQKIVISK